MIRFLCQILLVFIVGYCAYVILGRVLNIVPTPKKLSMQVKKRGLDINQTFRPLFSFVSKFVYMEPQKEQVQQETLYRAGINLTPKEVVARSICGLAIGLAVALWGTLLGNTLFTIIGIVLGIALFGMSSDDATQRLKEKDAEVKKELPKFVSTIIVSLRSEKNIIKIIESYIKDARPALRSDLEILLSQMSTGNIETALRNFDIRMGAQEITSLTTCLIYIENGIDQTAALQYLESDMRQAQATLRRLELDKLPGKMRTAFVPVAFVLIAIFFYTIGMSIVNSFVMFF